MTLPVQLQGRLSLPLIVAPMFLVSGPDLVVASCTGGAIGTFPSLNLRSAAEFGEWLSRIEDELAAHDARTPGGRAAPYGVNIVAHRTNRRLEADMALVEQHRVPLVITSVGKPRPIVEAVHRNGGLVFHDATTVEWAAKAADDGVDGLILVCAGAGGHGGLLNPFAFVPEVRAFWRGALALSGCISDGRSIRAAEVLGADLAYVGTRFIATDESMASRAYKDMLIACGSRDLVYTPALSGIPANMLRPSIVASGMDPDDLPQKKGVDVAGEFNQTGKAWRDIWTAGQGVGAVRDVVATAELIARMKREYLEAAATPRSARHHYQEEIR